MFAVLIALAVLGIVLYYCVVVLERIFAGWADQLSRQWNRPRVGNKEFDYSPQGMAAARKEASRSGKPMQKTKKKKFGAMGEGKPRMMSSY